MGPDCARAAKRTERRQSGPIAIGGKVKLSPAFCV
jgi:hypothetical protein